MGCCWRLKNQGSRSDQQNSLTSFLLQLSPNNLTVEKEFPAPFAGLSLSTLPALTAEALYCGPIPTGPRRQPATVVCAKK
ncbi:hypothetical protein QWZ13_00020 [Reinekea marina]|uniref:hypothetical protein n=1 Tax=Reinekea marina TaxID=1310421 RepID=UPI0025B2AF72|nr:hypothetical protein [Reinekea marina]MDN3647288.1 hypothetical protein [Reinekea marina]